MLKLTSSYTAPQGQGLLDALRAALETTVYPYYRQWANDLLDERIAGPNKGDIYTVSVDGVAVPGREGIDSAKRVIVIRFVHATVRLAVSVLQKEMRAAIASYASPREWIRRSEIEANVLLFFNGQRINAATDIKDFMPGDYIQVVPSHINQAYGNASKFGANGYMGKAARRLRTKLRITKRDSALTLFAGRSRKAWEMIKDTRTGRHMTKPEWGAWALTLRYRKDAIFRG